MTRNNPKHGIVAIFIFTATPIRDVAKALQTPDSFFCFQGLTLLEAISLCRHAAAASPLLLQASL